MLLHIVSLFPPPVLQQTVLLGMRMPIGNNRRAQPCCQQACIVLALQLTTALKHYAMTCYGSLACNVRTAGCHPLILNEEQGDSTKASKGKL